ncbi:hypothetical protein J2X46_004168 [Nocardioides sp. BE266]|uniref:DUF7144 family membrane protein n=1 Tax=Nocardioides sp. BE266 TaxID=2817725 RepID=UPI002857EF86|nr:AI-2E family transporter [Nocardioides sp. BE266]MDR7255166.1 hypothetical protein [Nocardioides sp. BE266]
MTAQKKATLWVGPIAFGAMMIAVAGLFNIISGLAAVFADDVFVTAPSGVLVLDVTGWGWVHLLTGSGCLATGIAILMGRTWARIAGSALVASTLATQMLLLPAYPFGSMIIIALVTNYIPNIGFVLGLAPPAVFALLTGGPDLMVVVLVAYRAINVVIQSVIQPKLVGDAVGISASVMFLSLVVWSWILGPLGRRPRRSAHPARQGVVRRCRPRYPLDVRPDRRSPRRGVVERAGGRDGRRTGGRSAGHAGVTRAGQPAATRNPRLPVVLSGVFELRASTR